MNDTQVRHNLMLQAKADEDLVAMKEVISMAETIEEAYRLARISDDSNVVMYVDHLASRT